MAPPSNSEQQKLKKIGMEGFGLIDEFFGTKGRPSNGNKRGDPDPVFFISSTDGTPHFGGVCVVTYPQPKSPTRWCRFHFKP
ncbi:hypothetical protein QN277_026803 [Acacia crassicarpa]|uniref:Uncharacterized protein n=1 Tax=Acacia crassicarpa TaxID=499986 RepID=A0AAE1J8D3_9FABA|nr:hypothetical protein QN277_026803 [Acacia crassicarpa]